MSEMEFINLFPNQKPGYINYQNQNNQSLNNDFYGNNFDEYSDMSMDDLLNSEQLEAEQLEAGHISNNLSNNTIRRSRINDYKHSSYKLGENNSQNGIYAQNNQATMNKPNIGQAPKPKGKKMLNISDEKMVWAGALFVFFGVFVFLIGYWLGKTILKPATPENDQYIGRLQEKLEEKKLETRFSLSSPSSTTSELPSTDTPSLIAPPSNTPINIKPPVDANKPIVAPPIEKPKPEISKPKTVVATSKPKTTPAVSKSTRDIKGNYTIQVSAHTHIDKARSVETTFRGMGYQAYIVETMVNGIRYFRVRIGKFGSKNSAKTALAKIKKSSIGKDGILIRLK